MSQKFDAFCNEIQTVYDALRLSAAEKWEDPSHQKYVAELITAQPPLWISILFYMRKSNQNDVRAIFVGDEKEAYLKEAIFSPEKFKAKETLKNHSGKNSQKISVK